MTRNPEVVCAILHAAEAMEPGKTIDATELARLGFAPEVVFEHVALLKEEGLLDASLKKWHTGEPGGFFVIKRLTALGHSALHPAFDVSAPRL